MDIVLVTKLWRLRGNSLPLLLRFPPFLVVSPDLTFIDDRLLPHVS
jgi:hypothetical protein